MPRPQRLQDAGFLHHVVSVGNDRQVIFKSPQDFLTYFDLLDKARKQYPIKIYNFCLMDNHIHLLVEPLEDGSLSRAMEYVAKGYAKYFNKTYHHEGHVFQGRFKSFLVQSERYFFACSRYIDLNPVKANLIEHPKDYQWSGYNVLAHGVGATFPTDFHPLYESLGSSEQERQVAYRALVFNSSGDELDLLNKRSCVLGDVYFKEQFDGQNK